MPDLPQSRRATLCWWSMALAMAWAVKRHYSVASAADLGWMLRPVAMLLELATGHAFISGPRGEWQSAEAGIVLVKACAGVNFLVMSFLGWCWLLAPPCVYGAPNPDLTALGARARPSMPWWLRLTVALALAWCGAVLVNTLRIVAALAFGPALGAVLGEGSAHRLIGLAVYLPALCAQLWLAGRERRGPALLLAAGLYGVLMLCAPLLTGNAWLAPGRYAAHALMLLLALAPLCLWGLRMHRRARPRAATLAARLAPGHNQRSSAGSAHGGKAGTGGR